MTKFDRTDGLKVGEKVIYTAAEFETLGKDLPEKEAEIEKRLHSAGLKHGFDDDRIQCHVYEDGTVAIRSYSNSLGRREDDWWKQEDEKPPEEEKVNRGGD